MRSAVFTLGSQPLRAMVAYQRSLAWQQLFHLALVEKRPAGEIKQLAVEVAESLVTHRRHAEAGKVLLEYGRDVEAAVGALVEGNLFADAIRLVSWRSVGRVLVVRDD